VTRYRRNPANGLWLWLAAGLITGAMVAFALFLEEIIW
jgi:hypothetical protein